MEIKENIAGLGKNHDQEARPHDVAKKQSDAAPATENLDMEPHSTPIKGKKNNSTEKTPIDTKLDNVHEEAADYAKTEHEKAENWENHNPDSKN